jgi:hypothetical protein
MNKLIIEKVDNGYIIKITSPENRSASVVSFENKNNVIDIVKEYLKD